MERKSAKIWKLCVLLTVLLNAGCRTTADGPVRLTVFGLGLEAGEELSKTAIAEFTRRSGVAVDVIPTLGSSAEQLRASIRLLASPATAPDLFIVDVVSLGALQDHLLDLSRYAQDEIRKHIPEALVTHGPGSRIVSLPFYINAGVLYYRLDLLEKYGFTQPPATWDELDRIALRIQESERKANNAAFWGYVWQGAAYEGLTCNALEWQASFGAPCIVERDGSSCLNVPAVVTALQAATRRIGTISPAGVLSHTEADTLKLFTSGKAVFMRQWTSAYENASRAMNQGTIGLAPLPSGPGGRAHTIGGFHIAVSRHSNYPRQASELAIFLTGERTQRLRALQRGFVPTHRVLHSDPELLGALPQLRVIQEAGSNTLVRRPQLSGDARYAEVSRAYYETVHAILSRKISAEAGVSDLHARLGRLAQLENSSVK
jgi:trehalose/maltose transport system substrate-binding protein